jgi:hypothetical protein
MLKEAFLAGTKEAFDRFDVKDAGWKERLMPLMLASGIGGGGTASAAAIKHMMPHHQIAPMAAPMAAPAVAAPALPSYGSALHNELGRLDAAMNAR